MDLKLEKKLKRNLPLDYINAFLTNLNMQSVVWVLYLSYCGLNLAEIGVIEGIYHATSILCEIPSGAAADLLGRKRSMILSRICTACSCVIMLFSKSFGLFAVSFAIQALGNNLNSGSEEALVYDSMRSIGQEEQYLKVYGKLNIIIEVSQGLATVLGGVLADYSYFWCYSACLVIAVSSLLPVLLMSEPPCTGAAKRQESIRHMICLHFKASFGILKSDSRIMKIIVYYSVVFAAETLLFFYSQQYYFELGYNKTSISLILLAVSLVSCLGAAMSEKIYRKFRKRTKNVAAFAIGTAILCYGFQNALLSAPAFAAAGFFNSALYPIQSEALNQLIPSEQRATLISVDSMFFSVAMILMFPLAGFLADLWGLAMVFTGIGLTLLLFVIVWNILLEF